MVKTKTLGMKVCAAFGAALLSTALFAGTALALPYTHSEATANAGHGVIHVAATLDFTAIGGPLKAVWLPINADDPSVSAALAELLVASEDKSDRFAHEDYNLASADEFLNGNGMTYSVAVYAAGSQTPGATNTYTSEAIGDESYNALVTGDAIYVTVTE